MIACEIVVGSGHIKIINCTTDKETVIVGCYGKDDQQAFDRLKRLINQRLKEPHAR